MNHFVPSSIVRQCWRENRDPRDTIKGLRPPDRYYPERHPPRPPRPRPSDLPELQQSTPQKDTFYTPEHLEWRISQLEREIRVMEAFRDYNPPKLSAPETRSCPPDIPHHNKPPSTQMSSLGSLEQERSQGYQSVPPSSVASGQGSQYGSHESRSERPACSKNGDQDRDSSASSQGSQGSRHEYRTGSPTSSHDGYQDRASVASSQGSKQEYRSGSPTSSYDGDQDRHSVASSQDRSQEYRSGSPTSSHDGDQDRASVISSQGSHESRSETPVSFYGESSDSEDSNYYGDWADDN